jgi:hypothetical protein
MPVSITATATPAPVARQRRSVQALSARVDWTNAVESAGGLQAPQRAPLAEAADRVATFGSDRADAGHLGQAIGSAARQPHAEAPDDVEVANHDAARFADRGAPLGGRYAAVELDDRLSGPGGRRGRAGRRRAAQERDKGDGRRQQRVRHGWAPA